MRIRNFFKLKLFIIVGVIYITTVGAIPYEFGLKNAHKEMKKDNCR